MLQYDSLQHYRIYLLIFEAPRNLDQQSIFLEDDRDPYTLFQYVGMLLVHPIRKGRLIELIDTTMLACS